MRFTIYGAGAIGGVLGVRLAVAGHDVRLIARGAHRDAMRERGLRLESPDGVETVRTAVAGEPSELEWTSDDVAVLAMKSQHTLDALDALAGCAPAVLPIVCAQNGVANERTALRFFTNVYGICVMCPAEHLEPGVVVAQCSPLVGLFDLGRYPSGSDALAREIAAALESARYESVVRNDVMAWKYAKLLLNLGNVVQATCAPKTGRKALVALARIEGETVLQAASIPYVSAAVDQARRGNLLQMRPVAGRTRGGGSTWQSLTRGAASLETDYLNGEIVLLGREHGVPTPVNALLQETGRRAASERLAPGSLRADELLAAVPA
jgi:2-dehydropantoate 2-reductase